MAIKRLMLTLLLMSSLVMPQARWTSENLVLNGDFASTGSGDGRWNTNGQIIADGVCHFVSLVAGSTLSKYSYQFDYKSGVTYKVTFTIKNYVSGSVRSELYDKSSAASALGTTRNSNGTYTDYLVCPGSGNDGYVAIQPLTAGANNTFDIDNIIVQEVLLSTPIAKAKTNFVTVPPSSLNESGLIYAYTGLPLQNKTAIDVSGNSNSPSVVSGTVVYSGGIEGGLTFPNSGYLKKTSFTGLNMGLNANAYTVSMRVKFNNVSREQHLCDFTTSQKYISSGRLWMSSSTNPLTSNTSLSANVWYSISWLIKAPGAEIYVNGVTDGSNSTYTENITGLNLFIGHLFTEGGDYKFNGEIKDLRIYNRVQTLAEIKAYHNQFAKVPYILEDFSDGTINKFPRDWTKGTGTYTVQQLATAEGFLKAGTKYNRCDVAGTIAFKSDWNSGRISFDVYKGADANDLFVYFISSLNKDVTTLGYALRLSNIERIILSQYNPSLLIDFYTNTSYVANNTWYHIDIERTIAGVFSVYITGGAFTTRTLVSTVGGSGSNPVTDATYTTSKWFVLDLDANDRFANLRMYKSIPVN